MAPSVETSSELLSGVRVVPGDPEISGLFLAMARTADDDRAQPMPPVGVQRRDDAGLELIRLWIESLDADAMDTMEPAP